MSGSVRWCAMVALLATGVAAAADRNREPTLKDLPKRQVEIRRDAPADVNAGKAVENSRRFPELADADPALRAEALGGSGQAAQAWGLLGPLRQQHAWPEAQLAERELAWAEGSLREADDGNVLAERWDSLPRALKTEPLVVSTYAARAAELGWDEAATASIEHALDARWDEALASQYGLLPVGRIEHRRARAAAWLKAHPASPALLLTLARLSYAGGDRIAAEEYLHRALDRGGGADAWEALGDAHAAAGDDAHARLCYANALAAARGDAVTPLPTREPHPQIGGAPVFEDRDQHGVPRLRE